MVYQRCKHLDHTSVVSGFIQQFGVCCNTVLTTATMLLKGFMLATVLTAVAGNAPARTHPHLSQPQQARVRRSRIGARGQAAYGSR
jgi:hypothetical protein